jgi:hypothetical protein
MQAGIWLFLQTPLIALVDGPLVVQTAAPGLSKQRTSTRGSTRTSNRIGIMLGNIVSDWAPWTVEWIYTIMRGNVCTGENGGKWGIFRPIKLAVRGERLVPGEKTPGV